MSHPANTLMAWSFIANGASPTTSSAPTAERGIAQLGCGPSSTSTPRPVRCVVSTCTRCGAIETVTLCASHTPVGTSLVLGCAITVVPRTARSAAAATTYSTARSVTPSSTRAIDKVRNPPETHTAPEAEYPQSAVIFTSDSVARSAAGRETPRQQLFPERSGWCPAGSVTPLCDGSRVASATHISGL